VLLSGKQGSGKTTIATLLREHVGILSGWPGLRMRFAEPLYQIHDAALPVLKQWGLVPEDCDKEGPFLQVVGTEYGRKQKGENCWVDIQRRYADRVLREAITPTLLTIEDARFENEFDAFPDAFRVRLDCDREVRQARTHSWRDNEEHPSETGLDAYAAQARFDLFIRTEHNPDEVAGYILRQALEWSFKGCPR
jgi:hypothetical protein